MRLSRGRVLLVDDNYDIRGALHAFLTCEGFDVALAADGREALDYLRTNAPPGLILLDWMMPVCDGATFRAEQRRDPALLAIPVALLTADLTVEDKLAALEVVAYLSKPIDMDVLLSLVRQYCDETAQDEAANAFGVGTPQAALR